MERIGATDALVIGGGLAGERCAIEARWRACYASPGTGRAVLYAVFGDVYAPVCLKMLAAGFASRRPEGERLPLEGAGA